MNNAVELSKTVYPEACFHQATEAFKAFGRVLISDNAPLSYRIRFEELHGIDPMKFRHEFLNYLLDLSLERHLEAV
jgi:hypothetical protein